MVASPGGRFRFEHQRSFLDDERKQHLRQYGGKWQHTVHYYRNISRQHFVDTGVEQENSKGSIPMTLSEQNDDDLERSKQPRPISLGKKCAGEIFVMEFALKNYLAMRPYLVRVQHLCP